MHLGGLEYRIFGDDMFDGAQFQLPEITGVVTTSRSFYTLPRAPC